MTITDTLPAQKMNLRTGQPLTSDAPAPASPYTSEAVKKALAASKGKSFLGVAAPLPTTETGQHGDKPYHVTKITQTSGDNYHGYCGLAVFSMFCANTGRSSEVLIESAGGERIIDALEDCNLWPLEIARPYTVDWSVWLSLVNAKMVCTEVEINMPPKTKPTEPVAPSQANPMEALLAANAAEIARAHDAADAKAAAPKQTTEWDEHIAAEAVKAIAEASKKRTAIFTQYFPWLKKTLAERSIDESHIDAIRDTVAEMITAGTTNSFRKLPADTTLEELERTTLIVLDKNYSKPAASPAPETTAEQAPILTLADAIASASDTPPAPEPATRQADDISPVEPPAVISGATPSKDDKSVQIEPVIVEKTPLPEAPFSANFHLIDVHGIDVQFTVRADTVNEGVKRTEVMIDRLLQSGWTTRGAAVPAGNGTAPAAFEPRATNGKSPCALIKVGTSYGGGKPQLQFECDGMEHTINFTKDKPEMVKLLSQVRQLNGSSFTVADLEVGRKFSGSWLVTWADNEGKEGKTYRNVLAVEAA